VPDKTIGREKKSRLHRWVVPARAEGLWCGAAGEQLRVQQRYQQLQLQWRRGSREQLLQGLLDGRRLRLLGAASAPQAAVWTTSASSSAAPCCSAHAALRASKR
jgi:hypothetical protein